MSGLAALAKKWKVCALLVMAACATRFVSFKHEDAPAEEGAQSAEWPPRDVVDRLADDKNRIVVVGANCGYLDFVDNLLGSLRKVGVNNFVIVPYDPEAHRVMSKVFPEHTLPLPLQIFGEEKSQFSGAVGYFDAGFGDLTRARPRVLRKFAEEGYTFFYSDSDTYWMKNVWKTIDEQLESLEKKPEILFSLDTKEGTDAYKGFTNLRILQERVCSCFMYVEPTEMGVEFLRRWENSGYSKDSSGNYLRKDDQAAMYPILRGGKFMHDVSFDFLDMNEFPSGHQFNETEGMTPSIVHNNYIVGHDAKKERFMRWDAWHPTGLLDTINGWTC